MAKMKSKKKAVKKEEPVKLEEEVIKEPVVEVQLDPVSCNEPVCNDQQNTGRNDGLN